MHQYRAHLDPGSRSMPLIWIKTPPTYHHHLLDPGPASHAAPHPPTWIQVPHPHPNRIQVPCHHPTWIQVPCHPSPSGSRLHGTHPHLDPGSMPPPPGSRFHATHPPHLDPGSMSPPPGSRFHVTHPPPGPRFHAAPHLDPGSMPPHLDPGSTSLTPTRIQVPHHPSPPGSRFHATHPT